MIHTILLVKLWFLRSSKGVPLEELTLSEFKQFNPLIEDDVYHHLSLDETLAKRKAQGGVSPVQVEFALTNAEKRLTRA